MTLKRNIALITGASSGIGEAFAWVCAEHQYDLILVARNIKKLNILAARLTEEHAIEVSVRECDLTVPDDIKKLTESLLFEGTPIEILINNAGMLEHGAFVDIPSETHQNILQLNVLALTAIASQLLPSMVARGHGRLLNVASIGAFQPLPSVATYAASKAFVLSLSESLAEELRDTGVTVTALCPGLTATNMMTQAQEKNHSLLKIPNLVISDPYEVAQTAFRACLKGKTIVVPGAKNILTCLLSRATPKWLVRRITGIFGRATLRQ